VNSTLDLSSSAVDFTRVIDPLLKLTQLVEITLCNKYHYRGGDESVCKLLDAIIGQDPNQFALPCLEYLSFTKSVSFEVIEPIWNKLQMHPAASYLREFPVTQYFEDEELKYRIWKGVVAATAIETLPSMIPWETALELLPQAPHITELSLDSTPRIGVELEEDSDPDLCVVATQDKIDFVAQNQKNLVHLQLWCPPADNLSLAGLSKLTMLRTDPTSIPKSARISNQHIVFPTSLKQLEICYEYPINPETLVPSITPLIHLTELVWSANSFGFQEFVDFMTALPLQLTRLELSSCLQKSKTQQHKPHTALINLPKLIELDISDDMLSKRGVTFKFAQAPRLRTLRFQGEKQAADDLLTSLSSFPHCKSSTLIFFTTPLMGRPVVFFWASRR
jgi:hypothetical protein